MTSTLVCKVSLAVLLFVMALQLCHSADLQRVYSQRVGGGPTDEVLMLPKKRPFCNAFTGCGRKRSGLAPGMPLPDLLRQRQLDEEALSNAMDEDQAQDLSRQLLAEAKMLQAIEEASAELYRRKQMSYPGYSLQ